MKKARRGKLVAACMCAAALTVAAVGSTFAYLTDTDSDVNVMTLGNVQIAQHEYERVVENGKYKADDTYGYLLKDFTQGKPLMPATELDANGNPYNYGAGDYDTTLVKMSQVGSQGSMQVFVNENAQDKFVTVENTGKSDAYVRTIIAYELGSVANFEDVIMTSCFMTDQGVWKVTDIGAVKIDGNNYYVVEYVYNGGKDLGGVHENGVLPAGDTTYPSLAQVYMKGKATNEDVEKIDGNNNGTYDILVLSQAVQVDGFADAATALKAGFGEANAANVKEWFGGMEAPALVADAAELADALADGDANILYTGTEPLVFDAPLTITGDVTISSANAPVEFEDASITVDDGASLEFKNVTVNADGADRAICVEAGSEVVFGEGAEIVADSALSGDLVAAYAEDAKVVLKGAKISGLDNGGAGALFDVSNGATLVIEDGTVISGNTVYGGSMPYGLFEVTDGGKLIMNGGEISGNKFAKALFNVSRGGTFTMNGGIITNNTLTGSSGNLFFIAMSGSSFEMTGGEISNNDLKGCSVFSNAAQANLNGNVVS